jgi:hypothetical protein
MTARRRQRANRGPFASRNDGAAVLQPGCAKGGFRARTSATRTTGNGRVETNTGGRPIVDLAISETLYSIHVVILPCVVLRAQRIMCGGTSLSI